MQPHTCNHNILNNARSSTLKCLPRRQMPYKTHLLKSSSNPIKLCIESFPLKILGSAAISHSCKITRSAS